MGLTKKIVALAIAFGITSWFISTPDTFDSSAISGKRVLITGASSGIGEQLAYQYAKNGAHVFITARREHLLKQVTEKCKQIGSNVAQFGYVTTDMNDFKQIENLVRSSIEQLGGLDVVIINHAHMPDMKNFDDLQLAMKELRTCLAVNTEAPAYIAGLTLPYLMQNGGTLGVVNSIAGKISMKYGRPYTASKFALDAYFASLRDEIKEANVSITNVVLGAIETENARKIFERAAINFNFPVEKIHTVSPVDTAEFIMKGVANRRREIYYPSHLNFVVFFREILTRLDLLGVE